MNVIHVSGSGQPTEYEKLCINAERIVSHLPDNVRALLCEQYPAFVAGSCAVNGAGNDLDIVVITEQLPALAQVLYAHGFTTSAAEVYRGIDSDGWFSAKLGYLNLLVSEPHIALFWEAATLACIASRKLLGRDLTKDERVLVHRHVWGEV